LEALVAGIDVSKDKLTVLRRDEACRSFCHEFNRRGSL